MNNTINTDLKNMFACLYGVFYFLSLHKFNSIYVIFHYLVSQLFKQKKKIFRYQLYKSADMLHFFTIQFHYFSKPAIFLAIFSFTLITCHIMASNLESHAIAIKFCFGV